MYKDLVIVLPGISGSVLAKDGKEVWGASTAAIWKIVTIGGGSIRSLAIKGVDDASLDDLGDGVKATGLVQDLRIIPGLWKIDGYTGLVNRLQSSLQLEPGRSLFEFAYERVKRTEVGCAEADERTSVLPSGFARSTFGAEGCFPHPAP